MLRGRTRYFVYSQNDTDYLVLDDHFRLVVFEHPDGASTWAAQNGAEIQREEAFYDFDWLLDWCDHPQPDSVDCDRFISAWNLLTDMCTSVPWLTEPFRRNPYTVLYYKLFYGLNLPPMTPVGRHWVPVWRASPVVQLRRVLRRVAFELERLLPSS